ncbi:MAG TPA: 4Fe-4S dicluster domain-containing protein [Desulfobacteraceae bacterium]|nr:4Fe-4S dicluster domain-containing protein [Desulfobacteraceae bacterium]
MKYIRIDKQAWDSGMDRAGKSYQLFGPVKSREHHVFQRLEDGQLPDMGAINTVLSPKSVLFPQTEKILETTLDESQPDHHIMKRAGADYSPRAVIGIAPCDARAVELLNLNFDTDEYKDPYWCDAYAATTFVGLAVTVPSIYDFTVSAGSGPFAEEGLDILLADCKDSYLAKVLTDKGRAFADAAGFENEEDSKKAEDIFKTMKEEAEAGITSAIETDRLREKNLLDLHQAPFWEDIAFSCINCGTCTFVCPTCWCFDIQDETKGTNSIRIRNWDTCMSPLFTLHGSGHNPRSESTQRVRQRFMHKLKYFVDKYDQGTMCVGCGRCVEHCPVNIDIRRVCNTMNAYEPEKP